MINNGYFQILITDEQIQYAKKLVEHSLNHHKVHNIRDGTGQEKRTAELRFTGTIGEVVFADTYKLERPSRSFGAVDGQDRGKDFTLLINGENKCLDIKSMHRKTGSFHCDYVLNIPSEQMNRESMITEYYFHISIHENGKNIIASFVGYIKKSDIKDGKTGILYKKGTKRIRKDKSTFTFYADTYEIDLGDFNSPPIEEHTRKLPGFTEKKIIQEHVR